jgi:hypothetical protein
MIMCVCMCVFCASVFVCVMLLCKIHMFVCVLAIQCHVAFFIGMRSHPRMPLLRIRFAREHLSHAVAVHMCFDKCHTAPFRGVLK